LAKEGEAAAQLAAFTNDYQVAGLLVLQDGKIRLERYALGHTAESRWTSFSVAKSVTSLLVGAAVKDGFIKSLDDPITQYIKGLRASGYDGVTVRQLLTMTTGVAWNEDYSNPNADVYKLFRTPPGDGLDRVTAASYPSQNTLRFFPFRVFGSMAFSLSRPGPGARNSAGESRSNLPQTFLVHQSAMGDQLSP
jgi:CubicO group peptidase (beta-lactamase class C family)